MTNQHLAAIQAGRVTKTNVIGLRKALNADARDRAGLSLSRVAPKLLGRELWATVDALAEYHPTVTGELHDSGLKLLRSPRYRKRLADVAEIVNAEHSRFDLVRFDWIDSLHSVPVYRLVTFAGSLEFRNVPWQSGGDGPEVLAVHRAG